MIKYLKKLWKDRRGNAIVIVGAALPIVVGAAGLGTDTVQWVLWKRELQRAADTAALAGVYAELQTASVPSAVSAHLADNNHTGVALLSGYPAITYPADTGNYTDAVRVELRIQRRLGFSSLFLANAPVITAAATAALIDDGNFCVVALNNSSASSITIGGSTNISMGCGAISNSTSTDSSVGINGGAYNFVADPVAGAGGMPATINGATNIQPHHVPMQDPFADKFSTDITGMTCNKMVNAGATSLTPGCYKSFQFTGNKTYTLAAGVYYLKNTDFDVQGTVTIQGTGVTIILTGDDPGDVKTNGNSGIQLIAPTSGAYADMLLIGMGDGSNTINGNAGSFYDGGMYFPNGTVDFTGNSGTMTQCAMVVANFVNFSGNSNLQNSLTHPDGTPCQADSQVEAKAVRLIA